MTRRRWLLWTAAAPLYCEAGQSAWEVLAAAASSLGLGNAPGFLSAFDPAIPGFAVLRSNVQSLLASWNVQASIELVEGGEEERPSIEVDWLLLLTLRDDASRSVRRRHRVKCRFSHQTGRWRIVEFTPLEMFAPPRIAG